MLMLFPKASNMRITYYILLNFLNALLDDKIDINNILTEDVQKKFSDSLLSKGTAVDYDTTDYKVIFDKEVNDNFDEESRKSIKHIFESKFFN